MAAPTIVAVASGAGTTSATVTRPVEVTAGDVLIAVAVTHGTTKLTQPAGWQVVQDGFTSGADPAIPGYGCMAWRRADSEPVSWTWSAGTSSTTVAVLVVRGAVETGVPFDSSSAQVNATSHTSGSVCPSIVTSVADTLVVAGVACMDNRAFSGWAVTDPGALVEAAETLNIEGLDSSVGAAAGAKASTGGATGPLAVDLVFSSYIAFLGAVVPSGAVSSLVTATASTDWAVQTAPTSEVTASEVLTWAVNADVTAPSGSTSTVRVRYAEVWRTLTGGVISVVAPTPPRDVAAAPSSGTIGLSWEAPYDDGGSPIAGYRLTLTPADVAPIDLPGSARQHTIGGLIDGRSYTVQVTARNSALTSQAAALIAVPAGAWTLGSTGPVVGAPAGWGGNGGVDNGRGYYAATEPPPGVWNGFQMGADYCGVSPVLAAQGKTYADLVDPPVGEFYDAHGMASGTVTYDDTTGIKDLTITRPGALVEYLDMIGQVSIEAPNVTIRYCRFDHRPVTGVGKYLIRTNNAWTGLNISYCELICGLSTSAAIPPYGSYTARYCEVWHCSNDAFKVGTDTLVEFCWVHTLNKAPGAHADSTQWTSGDNIAIRFCRFDLYEGGENAPSPELVDMANGAVQVGHMTGDGSWFEFSDNYGDASNLIFRPGVESPQTTSKGTFYTTNAFWYRNRAGLRFIGGPVRNATVPEANQIFDDTNVWHVSGQTYHRQGTNPGTWYYSHIVAEGEPLLTWTAAHFGTYP